MATYAEKETTRPETKEQAVTQATVTATVNNENEELVKKLEIHGQRKKELGMLIKQLHSMMDDEPMERLKTKLKEIEALQNENKRLVNQVSEYEDKVLQVETDAAQQVQSVLDTNEKLQKELVKKSIR